MANYVSRLEVDPPTVGRMSVVRWSLTGTKGERKLAARLTLTITHLEKGKSVFSMENVPVAGEFSMQFQFTDGDEYRVAAVVSLYGGETFRAEKIVSVTPVEPPVSAMIPALAFFLAVTALGLGVGRWSKRSVTAL